MRRTATALPGTGFLTILGLLLALAVPAAAQAAQAPLAGTLARALAATDAEAWRTYKTRFVTETGRVVDTGNGGISHSEARATACSSPWPRTTALPSSGSGPGPAPT